MHRLLLAATLVAALPCARLTATTTSDPALGQRLQPLAAQALDSGMLPGLQIAVVMRDGRLWSDASGVADLDSGRPVRTDTRFYLASTSKAIMGLLAAELDHRGEIDLDLSLAEAFPEGTRFHHDFDPIAVTVRDLLTHTHGLAPGPMDFLIAYTGQYSNELLLRLLASSAPAPNREFRYSNTGYNLYGILVDPTKTRGWMEIQKRLVLDPLGMRHTTNQPSTLSEQQIAMPHEVGASGMERIRLAKDDQTIGPAGGHFGSAQDLARLLLMELQMGQLDGKQLFAREVIASTQSEQVKQDRDIFYYHRHAWGIGWDIGRYDGDLVLHRPGGFAGYFSNAAFLPEHGFAVAVTCNGGSVGGQAAEALMAAVYDELRGRQDASARLGERLGVVRNDFEEQRAAAAAAVAERVTLDAPLRPLADYAGRYTHPVMGEVLVSVGERGLQLAWGSMFSELLPQPRPDDGSFDPFFAQLLDQDDQVQFQSGEDGEITQLSLRGIPAVLARQR